MKVLELFSGTSSFGNVCKEKGHQVTTIDINPKFKPDICIDINLISIPHWKEEYDIIWASPPCEQYSHAKRKGIRDLKTANKNVLKTLEIIKEFKPKFWIIENPQTGLLKEQEFMKELPYFDTSYCKYGMPYRKQTRFWTNIPLKLSTCNKDCNFMNGKKHIGSAGNGRKKYTNKNYKKTEKYVVPKQLCIEILKQIEKAKSEDTKA